MEISKAYKVLNALSKSERAMIAKRFLNKSLESPHDFIVLWMADLLASTKLFDKDQNSFIVDNIADRLGEIAEQIKKAEKDNSQIPIYTLAILDRKYAIITANDQKPVFIDLETCEVTTANLPSPPLEVISYNIISLCMHYKNLLQKAESDAIQQQSTNRIKIDTDG